MSKSDYFESEILIIFNIPENFGSADLRRFFSEFTEAERIASFHYKRRPELKLSNFDRSKALLELNEDVAEASGSEVKFNCCPIKMDKKYSERFVSRFNKVHWTNDDGTDLDFKCFVIRGSKADHWNGLDESKPPPALPRGNVGTTTEFLMESIRD